VKIIDVVSTRPAGRRVAGALGAAFALVPGLALAQEAIATATAAPGPLARLGADLAALLQPGRLDGASLAVGVVLALLPTLALVVATRRMLGRALREVESLDAAGQGLARALLAEPDGVQAWVGGREVRSPRLAALLGLDAGSPAGFPAVLARLTSQDSARLDLAVRRLRGDGQPFDLDLKLREGGRQLRAVGVHFARDGREPVDLLWVQDHAAGAAQPAGALDALLAPAAAPAPAAEEGWFGRLKAGLAKSSSRLTQGLGDLFTKRRIDDEALEELEELLISADLGVTTATKVTAQLSKTRFGDDVTADEIKAMLAQEITRTLEPVARPLVIEPAHKPHVVLVVGVNGSGKTTTIGKLAKQQADAGLKVILAAGDTFRAAAVEQLKVWGERTGCPVIARDTGADAAGLAYDALAEARRDGADLLFIDTAGRLQNKSDLMAELAKVVRSIKKVDETAPHSVLLVLDSTVGQNAHSQVEIFKDMVNVTGLVLTKLDGTARGGVLVALAEKFGLPVHAIGVGEKVDDLRPFEAEAFARSLVGLD